MRRFKHRFRAYFIPGLLVVLPLGGTVLVLDALIQFADQLLVYLPAWLHPDGHLPFHLPGIGLFFAVLVVLCAGLLVDNPLGRRLVQVWEAGVRHLPLVRNLYGAIKQLLETLFSPSPRLFSRVVLLEYPRHGVYAIGFVTSIGSGEVQEKTKSRVLNIFLPTTPNPTSGFLLFVPEAEVIPLTMSVEEGLKMVISGGFIVPPWPAAKGAGVVKETGVAKGAGVIDIRSKNPV